MGQFRPSRSLLAYHRRPIAADISHLARDWQMVLDIRGELDVKAQNRQRIRILFGRGMVVGPDP